MYPRKEDLIHTNGVQAKEIHRLTGELKASSEHVCEMEDTNRAIGDLHASCLTAIERLGTVNRELSERVSALADVLNDVFAMMDEGFLVRDVSNDGAPDWTVRMMGFVSRLKAAHDLIASPRKVRVE